MGRISAVLSDELEKKLRLKALETFGGRKGDLSRAIEEAVKTWVTTEKQVGRNKFQDDAAKQVMGQILIRKQYKISVLP